MNIPHSHHAQVMKMKFTHCDASVHGHSTDARAFCTTVSHAVLHGGQLHIQMCILRAVCHFCVTGPIYQPGHGIENQR